MLHDFPEDLNRREYPETDELTTEMHEEFIGDEISHDDLMVLGVLGAMRRGLSKQEALARYGLTEEFYDENIDRALQG